MSRYVKNQGGSLEERLMSKAGNAMKLLAHFNMEKIRKSVKNVAANFFRDILKPLKILSLTEYLLVKVRYTQLRFKKHIKWRKTIFNKLVNIWRKEVNFFSNEMTREYPKLENIKKNLFLLTTNFRNCMINLLIEKQLNNYLEIRYDIITGFWRSNANLFKDSPEIILRNTPGNHKKRVKSLFGGEKLLYDYEHFINSDSENEDSSV